MLEAFTESPDILTLLIIISVICIAIAVFYETFR